MGRRNYSGTMGRHLAYFERTLDPATSVHIVPKPAVMVLRGFATSVRTPQTPVLPDHAAPSGEFVCRPEPNTGRLHESESHSEDINPCL
jgi:hypothetical protein